MSGRGVGAVVAILLAVAGCSRPDSSQEMRNPASGQKRSTAAPASFVNRVWVVAESKQVAPDELRVFLSEGTLVMASPHGTPALGSWRYVDGHLTITEEGLAYRVDILDLSEDAFRIRIYSPGDPIEILFRPADQPAVAENLPRQSEGRER